MLNNSVTILRSWNEVPFFLICPLIDSPRVSNMYFRTYPGSWFLITRRTVSVDRLILYPKVEASAVIPDILIHFRRLDQARSLGSRSGHRRSGGRPARNSPSLSLSFYPFPPLPDPLIGDAWVLHSEIRYDSRNHPPRMTTLQLDDLTAAITCLIARFRPHFPP